MSATQASGAGAAAPPFAARCCVLQLLAMID
jgi:hypothetical protein